MRITGGKARSIALDCPRGDWVRPATDRMRESVFSALGTDVEGSVFLDLYAGAGTYGLEALSRGAKAGVFVEQHREACTAISRNLDRVWKSLGSREVARNFSVQAFDVFKWLDLKRKPDPYDGFDLVFVDPPYTQVEAGFHNILSALVPLLSVSRGAWVIFESPVLIDDYPPGYALRKTFGKGREDTRAMLLSWLPNR